MLLNFSLGNFRSFNKLQTIDFRATGLVSEDKEVDDNNIATISDNPVLKTIGIYGANGSGKSNLIWGLSFLKNMIVRSLDSEDIINELYFPFRLTTGNVSNNGYFQVTILIENKKYRYGFTIKDKKAFAEEWLFGPAEKNETFYFKRKVKWYSLKYEIYFK